MSTTKNRPVIFGITGLKRAGKDSLAQAMDGLLSVPVLTLRFAAPLHQFARAWFEMTEENKDAPVDWLYHSKPHAADEPVTPRYIMQTLGTEWGRKMVHPDIWLNIVRRQIEIVDSGVKCILIPDVRFDNEADMIQSLGGNIVLVTRSTASARSFDEHTSESGISTAKVDYCIENSGTLRELEEGAYKLLNLTGLLSLSSQKKKKGARS